MHKYSSTAAQATHRLYAALNGGLIINHYKSGDNSIQPIEEIQLISTFDQLPKGNNHHKSFSNPRPTLVQGFGFLIKVGGYWYDPYEVHTNRSWSRTVVSGVGEAIRESFLDAKGTNVPKSSLEEKLAPFREIEHSCVPRVFDDVLGESLDEVVKKLGGIEFKKLAFDGSLIRYQGQFDFHSAIKEWYEFR